jgi:hypothetical protein
MSQPLRPAYADPHYTISFDTARNTLIAAGPGTPAALSAPASGYAAGAIFIDTSAGVLYQNTGTTSVAVWSTTSVALTPQSDYTQTYSTADKTQSNPTAAVLTVADGAGTNDNTIGAITADASVIAAVQELADEINKLVADVADVKQITNALIDDLQALGLVA